MNNFYKGDVGRNELKRTVDTFQGAVRMSQVPKEERATLEEMLAELIDYALDTRNEVLFRKLTNLGIVAVREIIKSSNNNLKAILKGEGLGMSEFKELFDKLEKLGMTISEDNTRVTCTTPEAHEYMMSLIGTEINEEGQYINANGNYILGNVPSGTESLENLDYEIMFSGIEEYSGLDLPSRIYSHLHVFVESDEATIEGFLKLLADTKNEEENKGRDKTVSVLEGIIVWVEDFTDDIKAELKDIIEALESYK